MLAGTWEYLEVGIWMFGAVNKAKSFSTALRPAFERAFPPPQQRNPPSADNLHNIVDL
jgi:hypothetical protein